MKRILICLALLSISLAAIAQSSHTINAQNQSPAHYAFGENVTMRVEVNIGAQVVKAVRLRYRQAHEDVYRYQYMKRQAPGSPIWEAVLKSHYIKDRDIQYYYEFVLDDYREEILPYEREVNGDYILSPGPMHGKLDAGFVLLSTEGEFESDAFVFAVSFFEIAHDIDLSTIKVWIGGIDVTRLCTITDNAVVYRNTKTKGGEARALVTAMRGKGKVQSQIWNIKAPQKGKARIPVNFTGNVNFATNIYDHDYSAGLTNFFENKNDWTAWGEASINYGVITGFTNMLFSSLEDESAQRVNRYTAGFRFPVWEVIAGDYSPKLSNFVLNNRNQFGLYSKLHGRQIGIEAMAGEIVRATMLPNVDDNGVTIQAPGGTFRQEVIGGRLRLGSENGFSIGINGARNRDIVSSLPKHQYSYLNQGVQAYSVTPQDTMVLSADMKINLPEQSVVLGAEVAGSLLNTNTLDNPITSEDIAQIAPELDFINPDQLSEIFVINRNMQPFMPSIDNFAATGYLRTIIFNNLLNFSFTAVGGAFNSLSINQYPKDTSQINITDHFCVGRYFNFNGGFNRTQNNLSLTRNETQISDTWFGQAMLRIPKFPYMKGSFFNTVTTNENNPHVQDASQFTPYKRNSNSLSVGVGYDIKQIPVVPSQLDITYRMGTNNSLQGTNETLVYENFSNSINFSMTNRLVVVPLTTQFVFSKATQDKDLGALSSTNLTNSNYNLFARAEYALFSDRLIPYTSYRRVNLTGDSSDQSFDYITLGLDASPVQDMSISTGISKKYEKDNNDPNFKNNLLTWNFMISQRF